MLRVRELERRLVVADEAAEEERQRQQQTRAECEQLRQQLMTLQLPQRANSDLDEVSFVTVPLFDPPLAAAAAGPPDADLPGRGRILRTGGQERLTDISRVRPQVNYVDVNLLKQQQVSCFLCFMINYSL